MALATPGSQISREIPQPLGGTAATVGLHVLVEMLSAVGLACWRFVHLMVSLLEAEFLVTLPHKHNPTELAGSSHETPCKFFSTASCNLPNPVYVTLDTGRSFWCFFRVHALKSVQGLSKDEGLYKVMLVTSITFQVFALS